MDLQRRSFAEGLGHRGDEADFAGGAIGKAVFAGGFAALVGNLLKRPAGIDALVDLLGSNVQRIREYSLKAISQLATISNRS